MNSDDQICALHAGTSLLAVEILCLQHTLLATLRCTMRAQQRGRLQLETFPLLPKKRR